MDLHFAWQARHFWHWTGLALVAHLGYLATSSVALRGRRGTWRHLHFVWQAWHLWHWAGSGGALGVDGAVDAAWVFTPLCNTPCFTHYFSHTIFDTPSFIQLCHTPSFTHNFVTPSLSHTTFTHTTFHTHTQLCHTSSLTHDLSHTTLSHTIFHTQSLTHHLTHTTFHHTIFHTHNFVTNHFSSTSSFVFPSFAVPAAKLVDHVWKKLTCGVMRSFNFLLNKKQFGALRVSQTRSSPPCSNWNTLRDHSMFFTGHGQCSC